MALHHEHESYSTEDSLNQLILDRRQKFVPQACNEDISQVSLQDLYRCLVNAQDLTDDPADLDNALEAMRYILDIDSDDSGQIDFTPSMTAAEAHQLIQAASDYSSDSSQSEQDQEHFRQDLKYMLATSSVNGDPQRATTVSLKSTSGKRSTKLSAYHGGTT